MTTKEWICAHHFQTSCEAFFWRLSTLLMENKCKSCTHAVMLSIFFILVPLLHILGVGFSLNFLNLSANCRNVQDFSLFFS